MCCNSSCSKAAHISVKWLILVRLCMTNLEPSMATTFRLSWSCSAFIYRHTKHVQCNQCRGGRGRRFSEESIYRAAEIELSAILVLLHCNVDVLRSVNGLAGTAVPSWQCHNVIMYRYDFSTLLYLDVLTPPTTMIPGSW